MSTAFRFPLVLGGQLQGLYVILFFLAFGHVTVIALDVHENFCRRFSHQSAVIGDRLYIDGGYVQYSDYKDNKDNRSNTLLSSHDLSTFGGDGAYKLGLHTDLNKSSSIPTVAGGVLWADNVDKRFYLYGGEWLEQKPQRFTLYGYDVLHDVWEDFGSDNLSDDAKITAHGAGVGVSETGFGYYYGGWASERSTSRWEGRRQMRAEFYSYEYDKKKFVPVDPPMDKRPRAEGGMVWIPAGDPMGMLVYMGGIVGNKDDDDTMPQPLDEILLYDASNKRWYQQNTTGLAPQHRRQFCVDVAWAPDKSSFNLYVFGGLAAHPTDSNATSYADVYILSIPSFKWFKIDPYGSTGNSTGPQGRYGSSCNMVSHMSNLFIIGGDYPNRTDEACDTGNWGVHGLSTGGLEDHDKTQYWTFPTKENYDEINAVPAIIHNKIGGDKNGNAEKKEPEGGFTGDNAGLRNLFNKKWKSPDRKPTRSISGKKKLGTGAIVGISIGSAVALALISFAWWRFAKEMRRRQQQKQQSEMDRQVQERLQAQQTHQQKYDSGQLSYGHQQHSSTYSYMGGSSVGRQSMVSPQLSSAGWVAGDSAGLHSPGAPPMELPGDYGIGIRDNTQSRDHELPAENSIATQDHGASMPPVVPPKE